MKGETPNDKWDRIQSQVQGGIAKAYPNPERLGCLSQVAIIDLARRSAEFDDSIEEDAQWKHVTHCSPCYALYLQEVKKSRESPPSRPK
jgi:hypothetical protein